VISGAVKRIIGIIAKLPEREVYMISKTKHQFDTRVIHGSQTPENWQGATLPPIYQSASHVHETAESLSETFSGKNSDHIYMRLTNPTNRTLEEKIAALEEGKAAVVTSSGMAAISNACMAMLRSGDEFVSGKSLFMSTYLLFTNIFQKYDIKVVLVDTSDTNAVEQAITEKTRFVYLETIGNPGMDVPDIARIASIAHEHGLPLFVDNTLATPYMCRPLELGADAVVHSTTKYFSGHGQATGGAIVDGGQFPWAEANGRFPDFGPFVERKGSLAFLDKAWREHHINFGTTQAPFHSYLTMLGMDTLALRMERHLENTLFVAQFLKERPEVKWVNYPGLSDHPSHDIAKAQFNGKGFGGMLTFGLQDQAACFRFINNLQMIYHLANLGDCKTLVIHPFSSQYVSFDDAKKESLCIASDMIRLSVGIEAKEDICDDIAQALEKTLK
jgi:O-acetylhomoserine (thiol)-lyase